MLSVATALWVLALIANPLAARAEATGAAELLRAATYGDVKRVRALLAQGADVNTRDVRGFTPLLRAALSDRRAVIEVLLAHGADVNAQDRDGYTALMRVAWRGRTDTAKLLFEHGADVNRRSRQQFTALHLAAWGGFHETLRTLLAHKPELDVPDTAPHQGYTALVRAAAARNVAIVQALLDAGARTDLKNSAGATALSLAVVGKHHAVIALLCAPSRTGAKEPVCSRRYPQSGQRHGDAKFSLFALRPDIPRKADPPWPAR